MSSVTTPKSDRSQILIAVLFMSFFATTVLIFVMAKDITRFVCSFELFTQACLDRQPNPAGFELVTSEISSACVGSQGLKMTVILGEPLIGEASIQVFTTGEDVFPTERGMSDSFETSMTMPALTDQLDIAIPVESMPVNEQIFGNIVTYQGNLITSHVTYFTIVSDCSSAAPSPDSGFLAGHDDIPTSYNVTCLPGNRLMVAFEFNKPIMGQFQALVANAPYNLVSVGNQPAILFFSGAHPGKGTSLIKLVSASDETVVFEENLTPPVCILD